MFDSIIHPGVTTPGFHEEPLLDEPALVGWLGVSPKTTQAWRASGKGPPFIRLPGSRSIRYRPADVRAWLSAGDGETAHG